MCWFQQYSRRSHLPIYDTQNPDKDISSEGLVHDLFQKVVEKREPPSDAAVEQEQDEDDHYGAAQSHPPLPGFLFKDNIQIILRSMMIARKKI